MRSMTPYHLWTLVAVASLSACSGAIAKASGDSPAAATLRMANGDFIVGELLESTRPDGLRWRAAAFALPLDFDLKAVGSVHFPVPRDRSNPKGEYCVELCGGDLLFGTLVALTAKEVELDCPHFGRLHIERRRIQRVSRWRNGEEVVYSGPNGLSGWNKSSPEGAWRQEANHLATDKDNSCIVGNMQIPSQACIELDFSWSNRSDFTVSLGGCDEHDKGAFRIELWDCKLVCLWETEDQADIALLERSRTGAGRCHLVVYFDQPHRRAVVFSADGSLLAETTLSGIKAAPRVVLMNRQGSLRLEQLVIRKYSGELPRQAAGGKSHLCRMDGTTVFGEVEGFDVKKNAFMLAENGRKTQIDAAQVNSIVWSHPTDSLSRDIHVCLHDGVRFGGRLREVKDGRLWVACPGVTEPFGVRLSDLQGLAVLNTARPTTSGGGRQGRLEMPGVSLHGCLVDGAEVSHRGCLAWQPRGSITASALLPGTSGKIVYRESPPATPVSQAENRRVRVRQGQPAAPAANWVDVLAGGTPRPSPKAKTLRNPANIYLTTGDTIPCNVKRIDKRGVWFESSEYQATFVPHDRIKAINLENASHDTKIDPVKRDRLLTLPRMRKDSPPMQLIRSVEGDYLRANIVSMDDTTLTVEVRLEQRRLPRSNIARIIWLHEGDASGEKAVEACPPPRTRVQTLGRDDNRMTFVFDRLAGTTLFGASDTLGQCHVDLGEVNQLFFGTLEGRMVQGLPYQRWKLHAAQEPKFTQESAETGMESALVGKPAPDFKLDKLDGTPFRLSDQRGKVVVLDFWATWCGACIQTMPQIDRVVSQHNRQDVLLVAVNLQERPEAVRAALKRLKLETTVVLDQDGAVAEKYAAVAIPQTVIIDRSGQVFRLFVGGGPQYAEQLREALQKAVSTGVH